MDETVKKYLSEIGRRGGSKTSQAKKISSAKNGLKGGRPPKLQDKAIRKPSKNRHRKVYPGAV